MRWLAGNVLIGAALASGSPALASFAVPPNAPGQYAPRDECAALPGAAQFLGRLKAAVEARDAAAFASLTSPDVILDFGGEGGHDAVREKLSPGSRLWSELGKIMALGCAFDEENGALVMPWFFAPDLGDSDPFSTSVTLGSAVPLRARPMHTAKVRARLDWQLVHIYEVEVADPGFVSVAVIGSDFEGYLEEKNLRSQLDYRIRAEKVGEEWRIVAFLAGD